MTTASRKIFLSIVTDEFASYRACLAEDLIGPLIEVKVQEDFIKLGYDTLSLLDEYIAACDIVIHLVGDMTGACPPAASVKTLLKPDHDFAEKVPLLADLLAKPDFSYTQWEAYLALYHRKRLFIFQPSPDAPRDLKFKLDPKQQKSQRKHLERLQSIDHWPETFLHQERLSIMVLRDLLGLGWGKELRLIVDRFELPKSDCPELYGREGDLELLDAAWKEQTHKNVVCLVAGGGVGKTSLINHWLERMKKDKYRGAKRVYGYSFYNQGVKHEQKTWNLVTSADHFFECALAFFGASNLKNADPKQKGAELARLVCQQRTLLILDGLEPLQHPPIMGVPTEMRKTTGEITDIALQTFLKGLADSKPGLCVISTRYEVADLKGSNMSEVQQIPLETLTPKAGAQLLTRMGVQGKQEDLEKASEEFGGHCLALTLLGSFLRTACHGDIRKRSGIRGLLEEDRVHGGHANRVMDSYEKWFRDGSGGQGSGAELNVLRLLGLFDRPADKAAVDALLTYPEIPGLTDLLLSLEPHELEMVFMNVRDAHLIAEVDASQPELNTHPLVREHFGRKLQKNKAAWHEGNSRLYEHFKNTPAEELPNTFEEMRPLFLAIPHGCKAARHEEVFQNVYWTRILREHGYFSTDELGAFGEDLAAASCFFTRQWDYPLPQLSELQKARLQSAAGWDLRGLGRTAEAIQALRGSMDKYAQLATIGNDLTLWEFSTVSCSQIAQMHLDRGELTQALTFANGKEKLAKNSGRAFWITAAQVLRALVLFQMGMKAHVKEVREICRKVEAAGFAKDAGDAVDHTFIAFRWCDLLFGQVASPCSPSAVVANAQDVQRVFEEVERRCKQIKNMARKGNPPRPHPAEEAVDLLRGRAHLVRALHGGGGSTDMAKAKRLLGKALHSLKKGTQELYLSGLRARAALFLASGNLNAAEEDLCEAQKVVEGGQMRLYEVDCLLQFVRLHQNRGEKKLARELLAKAQKLIITLGYHRRDQDLAELKKL